LPEISLVDSDNFLIKYSNIRGGSTGEGNIDADPQFTDSENVDFTLQPSSPCIDAGDPTSDLDPDGTRADMGAYPFYHIWGCTDESACNYASDANTDDGSCEYEVDGCDVCGGNGSSCLFNVGQSQESAFYYFDSASLDGAELLADDWILATNPESGVLVAAAQYILTTGDVIEVVVMGEELWELDIDDDGIPDITCDSGPLNSCGMMLSGQTPQFAVYDFSADSIYNANYIAADSTQLQNIPVWNALDFHLGLSLHLITDCNGDLGGAASLNECGCYGGNTGIDDTDCIQDCNGDWGGSAELDECDVCGGDNSSCTDCCGVPNGDNSTCGSSGDINGGGLDITDVIIVLEAILLITDLDNECDIHEADVIADGSINILDILVMVQMILGDEVARINNIASSVELIQKGNQLSYNSNGDGLIGFELTLSHDIDCGFSLSSDAFVADYNTSGTTTKMVIVINEGGNLFTSTGDFRIVDVLAGTSFGAIDAQILIIPESFELSTAYPNPFNPTTTLSFAIPIESDVYLSIYNLQGREVSTLIDANMDAGYHSIVWDANSYASGVYFVKMVAGEFVNTQKLMLVK